MCYLANTAAVIAKSQPSKRTATHNAMSPRPSLSRRLLGLFVFTTSLIAVAADVSVSEVTVSPEGQMNNADAAAASAAAEAHGCACAARAAELQANLEAAVASAATAEEQGSACAARAAELQVNLDAAVASTAAAEAQGSACAARAAELQASAVESAAQMKEARANASFDRETIAALKAEVIARRDALEAELAALSRPKEASQIASDIVDFVSRKGAAFAASAADTAAPHIDQARSSAAAGAVELSRCLSEFDVRAREEVSKLGPYYRTTFQPALKQMYNEELLPIVALVTNATFSAARVGAAALSTHYNRFKVVARAKWHKHVVPAYDANILPLVTTHFVPMYEGTLLPFYRTHIDKHISAAEAVVSPAAAMATTVAAAQWGQAVPAFYSFVEQQRPLVAANIAAARAGFDSAAKASLVALARAHTNTALMATALCGPPGERILDWVLVSAGMGVLYKFLPLIFRASFFAASSAVRGSVVFCFTLPMGILLFPFRKALGTKPSGAISGAVRPRPPPPRRHSTPPGSQ